MTAPASSAAGQPAQPGPHFGRFELLRLLGKSQGTMVWLVNDPRTQQQLVLTLPRVQPVDPGALEGWLVQVRQASRLAHPHLAKGIEVAVQEHWPYLAVDRSHGVLLSEWLAEHPHPAPVEVVGWICQVLEGLAFAHDSGSAHHDLQLHSLQISDSGRVQVMSLGTSSASNGPQAAPTASASRGADRAQLKEADALRAHRDAAGQDVLACGVLLHRLLTGVAPLDESDVTKAVWRLPPLGHDFLRLPWSAPHPIPEALRAIANRSTSSQPTQHYVNARSFLRALQGWMDAEALGSDGPLELMLDRLRTVGVLPAGPGISSRIERLTGMDGQHTEEISHHILQDMALTFELLREVNSAQVQNAQGGAVAPVLTIRRSMALMGLNGVRRAAHSLRQWPGPLSEGNAKALRALMDRVRLAGYTAQALRPAGYDGEVVYLVTVLQNLGRLLAQYHFPDEFEQIRRLMQSPPAAPDASPGAPLRPGWSESEASFAVLGIDIEALGAAVARHWGLGEEMLHMIRCLPKDRPVRAAESDSDTLRITASAANEAVDALLASMAEGAEGGPVVAGSSTTLSKAAAAKAAAVRNLPAQRYAKSLGLTPRGVQEALATAREALRTGAPVDSSESSGRAEAVGLVRPAMAPS
jgi:non-specific serine/threonine protein kinase